MDMHEVLEAVSAEARPSVLATIVCAEGHSYRKSGAAILLRLGGGQVGAISPGCLEQDLIERAPDVWTSGKHAFVDYNMNPDEDAIWGEAVGCGGKMRLLLEPVDGKLRSLLLEIRERNAQGESIRLTRSWDDERIEYSLDGAETDGGAAGGDSPGDRRLHRMSVAFDPKPRLVVFGAGQDAEAILSLAGRIGFRPVLADWRPALCSRERFPGADIVVGDPGKIVKQTGLCAEDYLIVCSHNLRQDKEMIRLALPLQLAYIGVMGSKKRIRMLFETFLIPSNVKAPIGLAIGADGPIEIAVSVAAELVAVRAERRALSDREAVNDVRSGTLFGGGAERKDGDAQAGNGAVGGHSARKPGAASAVVQPS
ncbi:XdhC family protein [Paenibacillus arenilitoris]|uniref:XdhC family protein n=1 Tax=Paenibacillus arenilitoris TaxID=2772299 RepID=UPI001CC255BB|nr:XdhC/CoxI family protein [Paenibacillus arenilitoris]